jgi:glycosyltransferase involved in cell wall biosynthesis
LLTLANRRPTHRPPATGPTRLAILATHPIQYFAPWFRQLAKSFDLEVLYAHRQDPAGQSAAGFGVNFEWDVPLLDGYRHRWLQNVSHQPGLQTFGGCDTPELFDLIHSNNYDALLVLGWNRKSFVQGIRAAWRNKVPVLARGDSQLRTERSLLKRALKFLPYRWFLPRINAHLYVGVRNREYLQHYGVRDEQLFFSPHFVDNDFFATRAEEARRSGAARAIREQFGIPHDACVALFVGKFIRKKRPVDLVKAAQLLITNNSITNNRSPNIHLLFVGSGELGAQLRGACRVVYDAELVQRSENRDQRSEILNPISDRSLPAVAGPPTSEAKPPASFAGFRNQSELPAFYAAADLLVLPSDGSETWGLVVNEAMACGVPAIASDAVGCTPDLIDPGTTGSTFPLGDVAALAQQLISFRGADRAALRRKCEAYSMERATKGLRLALKSTAAAVET